jgi:hypothetical protein
MKRSGNWWIGVAAGLTLGAAGFVTVDQATETASAQSGFSVSSEQLRINQRISQAAVRRSNESLNLLDPIRKSGAQDDAPGWGTAQVRDSAITTPKVAANAVTTPKIAAGAVTNDKLAHPVYWAVVNADGSLARSNGATSSAKVTTDPGAYKVTFAANISACAYTATVGGSSTATPPVGTASTYQNPDPANTAVTVRTYDDVTSTTDPVTGGADRGFHLTVSC